MPSRDELIKAYQFTGWQGLPEIEADIAAGNWRDKYNNYLNATQGGGGNQNGSGGMGTYVDTINKALEFDEAAAKAAAEQEWNPYYDETLNDYLESFGLGRSRSQEDLNLALAEINRQAPQVQEQIGGQAADAGLYFSGQRQEQQRLADEAFQRQREAAQRTQSRYIEDTDIEKRKRERDLAREREAAITGQVETQRAYQYGGYG
jgi:hypothetical protein